MLHRRNRCETGASGPQAGESAGRAGSGDGVSPAFQVCNVCNREPGGRAPRAKRATSRPPSEGRTRGRRRGVSGWSLAPRREPKPGPRFVALIDAEFAVSRRLRNRRRTDGAGCADRCRIRRQMGGKRSPRGRTVASWQAATIPGETRSPALDSADDPGSAVVSPNFFGILVTNPRRRPSYLCSTDLGPSRRRRAFDVARSS